MRFDIITTFPAIFSGFISESLISKAIKKRLILVRAHNLRKWTTDRHQTVDGKPYGGGPGLVFKVEPIYRAVKSLLSYKVHKVKRKVILFSPRGKQFDQAMAKKWAKLDQLILICGRYEGVDERVAEHIADEVVSMGDYVLNGGEVAAMAAIEAVSRQLPGFMHKEESAIKEDFPQYTRPEVFVVKPKANSQTRPNGQTSGRKPKFWKVPKVLLSGNHSKIEEWRRRNTE